ncbi:MAG TPA: proton-conducting transporter membrane subunit [Candidatus Acidoferrum sp.]|jgi:NADH-quinone oxidoreductase subunit N
MPTHTLDSLRTFMQGSGAVLLPEMELALFALGLLLIDVWVGQRDTYLSPLLALAGTTFSGATLWILKQHVAMGGPFSAVAGSVSVDPYFLFISSLLLAATAMIILLSAGYGVLGTAPQGRYYALLLSGCVSLLLTVSATDLVILFLALELAAMVAYLLAAHPQDSGRPHPAAVQFFFPSAFGSAILAYAFSLLYGLGSSTSIYKIDEALQRRRSIADVIAFSHETGVRGAQMYELLQSRLPVALQWHPWMVRALPAIALVLLVFGFLVKLKALAAHFWKDRPTTGAPAPVLLFFCSAYAVAFTSVFTRLILAITGDTQTITFRAIALIALVLVAWAIRRSWRQPSAERILAYTALAHVGFFLLSVASIGPAAMTAMLYYFIAYIFMLTGAFVILTALRRQDALADGSHDVHGLFRRNPMMAFLFTIFLLSLAGVPPSAGYLARKLTVRALFDSGHPAIAWVAIGLSVLLAGSYLLIIGATWREDPSSPVDGAKSFGVLEALVVGVCVFVSVAAGLYAEPFLRMARYALEQ